MTRLISISGRATRALVAAVLLLASASYSGATDLDGNLCPKGKPPPRHTILLLDNSDPLTPKHRAELERLVSELQTSDSARDSRHFYVAPGEALIVYQLEADWRELKPKIHVCNPGSPDDWPWWKPLYKGKYFALQNWKRFEEKLKLLYPDRTGTGASASPILENLGVIVPRHAPSKRSAPTEGVRPVHLILFSDLLQHSELLSHYGPYPGAKKLLATPALRELRTDLARVQVSLFRLERSEYARWQTRNHYYWWTHLIRAFNGTIHWQESL